METKPVPDRNVENAITGNAFLKMKLVPLIMMMM